jgi:hypothetical protein
MDMCKNGEGASTVCSKLVNGCLFETLIFLNLKV